MLRPTCTYCHTPATRLAAQSIDQGVTVDWVPICDHHADGWNDGGDWDAPVYILVEVHRIEVLMQHNVMYGETGGGAIVQRRGKQ
jgi:hypothetical protein